MTDSRTTACPIPPADLLAAATDAAGQAGRHALDNHARRGEAVASFAHDVKLRLDQECQAIAEQTLRTRFPGHAILGEEGIPAEDAGSDFRWIIDPIDGTVNFSHGLPFWCCSIAVEFRGETVAGVVNAPALGECYTAAAGEPALCNGRALAVSEVPDLAQALVMTGLDKNVNPRLPPFELFRELSARVQKARIMGSAAIDICRVAAGQADGYFETGIYIWDVAAAAFIVRQAGGRAEILRREPGADGRLSFIASNGRIHAALRQIIEPRLA